MKTNVYLFLIIQGIGFLPFVGSSQGLNSRTIPASNPKTFDGSIDLQINFGQPPYHYKWEGPNGYIEDVEDLKNIAAGIYCVTVTDQNFEQEEYCVLLEYNVEKEPALKLSPQPNEKLDIIQATPSVEVNNLYPNPFSQTFNLVLKATKSERIPLTLIDAQGRTVFGTILFVTAGENKNEIQLPPNFPIGLYWMALQLPNHKAYYYKVIHLGY